VKHIRKTLTKFEPGFYPVIRPDLGPDTEYLKTIKRKFRLPDTDAICEYGDVHLGIVTGYYPFSKQHVNLLKIEAAFSEFSTTDMVVRMPKFGGRYWVSVFDLVKTYFPNAEIYSGPAA